MDYQHVKEKEGREEKKGSTSKDDSSDEEFIKINGIDLEESTNINCCEVDRMKKEQQSEKETDEITKKETSASGVQNTSKDAGNNEKDEDTYSKYQMEEIKKMSLEELRKSYLKTLGENWSLGLRNEVLKLNYEGMTKSYRYLLTCKDAHIRDLEKKLEDAKIKE